MALVAIGCAGASPSVIQTRGTESNASRSRQASKPVLATIEAAAIEALTAVHRETRRVGRRRLQVGVIRRSGDGYTYSEALRSESTVGSSRPLKVRYRMGPDAVATYVVHPRSGRHRIDRMAETPTPESRRIVDELDPRHRPLYLLTPSLEIVRHVHGRPVRTSERLSELFRERISGRARMPGVRGDLEPARQLRREIGDGETGSGESPSASAGRPGCPASGECGVDGSRADDCMTDG